MSLIRIPTTTLRPRVAIAKTNFKLAVNKNTAKQKSIAAQPTNVQNTTNPRLTASPVVANGITSTSKPNKRLTSLQKYELTKKKSMKRRGCGCIANF